MIGLNALEGQLRDAMYQNGSYHDVIWMGMFQDEFKAATGGTE